MKLLTPNETAKFFRSLVDAAKNGSNASPYACMINLYGDPPTVKKFLAIKGMIDLFRTALPKEQRSIGLISHY